MAQVTKSLEQRIHILAFGFARTCTTIALYLDLLVIIILLCELHVACAILAARRTESPRRGALWTRAARGRTWLSTHAFKAKLLAAPHAQSPQEDHCPCNHP